MYGVYWIRNKSNGRVYIGSTARSFAKRWSEHERHLAQGRHCNTHLQRAWNKYGKTAFEFRVLQVVTNSEDVIRAEQDWLDRVRLDGIEVYNGSTLVTATFLGRHHSPETRRKIAQSMMGNQRCLGRRRSPEAIAAAVASRVKSYPALVNMYTMDMIPAGSNIAKMCRANNLVRRTILHLISDETEVTRGGWMVDPYYA